MPTKTPLELFGILFEDLHTSGLWPDGKTISDAIPLATPEEILRRYELENKKADFDLKEFFNDNFKIASSSSSEFKTDKALSAEEHIHSLWSELLRPEDKLEPNSSRLPLPFPYIVPGGRFNEIYYWDSYFTMLGLKLHDKVQTIESIVDNFAWLIDQYGFIPNGSRTYFLGRSQPPFFSLMVDLLAGIKGLSVFDKYQPILEKEYQFWMDEKAGEQRHLVALGNGSLNRYYDRYPQPREEMYGDDLELLKTSGRESADLFKDIRAACESGWDFSSRWFRDYTSLSTIRTSELLPVDLNCLLYFLEETLAKVCARNNDTDGAAAYMEKAEKRRMLIQEYFWNDSLACFSDYDFVSNEAVDHINLATVYPLYFKLATNSQADQVAEVLEKQLLKEGGLITTTIYSGQQWDAPNGWAPLQWMAVQGLDNYGRKTLAREIARRWVALNEKVYQATGKFVEKYNVEDMSLEAGGGEYPVQDGFGWSNGVYLALKAYLDSDE